MATIHRGVQRVLTVLGLGGAFIMMASIFSPDRSQADIDASGSPTAGMGVQGQGGSNLRIPQNADSRIGAGSRRNSAELNAGRKLLGTFETHTYTVQVYSGRMEPAYTIFDVQTGEVLATLLSAEEASERFPELDLSRMNEATDVRDAEAMQLMLWDADETWTSDER